jgi:acyl transferase domain-containing protein/acyl carrier protein
MLAVGLPARAARALLDGREGRVSIAAINSPSAVTLSGDGEALAELSVELERRQVFNRFLQVEVPYHSPLMEPLKDELCRCLEGLQAKRPAVALYSTVTGALVQDACHGPGYWYHNIRQPVLLADAVDRILDDGHTIFLELGPHPVLAGSINESMTRRGIHGGAIASLRRGQQEALTMAQAVGSLYTSGCSIDWNGLHPEPRRHVRLPTYPWQREKYWSEAEISMADRISNAVHPLLGVPLSLPVSTWECELSANVAPYLADHVIEGLPVLPATAYVEAGLALHALIDGGGGRSTLEDVEFTKALIVDPRNNVRLQWNYDEKTRECRVYSRPFGDKGVWTHHAKARLASASSGPAPQIDLETLKACCGQHLDGAELYGRLRAHGLEYGPAFQRVREVWRRPGEVVARLDATLADETNDAAYRLHPALLDACFQSIFATLDDATDEAAGLVYVPVRIQQIRYFGKPTATCWCHGQLTSKSRSAIEANLVLCDADGHTLAQVKGLRCSAIRAGKTDDARWAQWAYSFAWEQGPPVASAGEPGRWLLFIDRQGVGSLLAEWLCRDGASAAIQVVRAGALPRPALSAAVPIPGGDRTAMAELVDRIGPKGLRGVVYLWGLDLPEGGGDPTGTDGAIDALHLLQALGETLGSPAPRVYVVTRGAQQVTPDEPLGGLRQAPLVGLCRVAACEHPSLRSTAIDVESTGDLDLDAVGQLASELLANSAEDDVALRRAGRYVHRLQRAPVQQFEENAATARLIAPANGHAFRLEVATPGTTDSLRFRQIERREPGPGEVEVKIEAAGLNFKDVLKVLGVLPERAIEHTFHGNRMGMEAGGVIARVGSGVHDYQVGDAIVASMRDCFSSHVTLPTAELFAVSRPTKLSALDAAALPVTYITAYYGLHKVARLAPGETVLIHAAAGGVGLAAIQVARWLGADILATAGSEEKRDYVRGLGIEHVWDSRNLDFADGVMAVTGGRGVDVVLNSVPGETFLKSLSLLAPYGRFIDIGKRDIVENGQMPMLPFERALTFTALDLDRMTAERPDVVRSLLQEVCGLVEAGHLGRLPIKVFPPAHAAEAFRYMALSKQIGKIVFDMDDTEGLSLLPATDRERPFRADATYLITGGCGGFGLELAEWLAAEGARYLVLAGRRGAATPAAQQVVEALTAQGVSVMASATDVAREADVVGLLAEIADKMPPLAGVFHLAAVLDDALLTNLDGARLRTVMAPKALGAWLLHEHTRDLPLDYFVLFSSASAWLGNVGQASYVAANAFLDALAQHRRAMGLPATSISWGAIGQVGMAAEREQAAEHLARMGVRTIPPGAATEALGHVLRWRPTGIALMDMDWSRWRIHALAESVPRFSPVLPDAAAGSSHTGSELRALLLATPPEARVEKLAAVIAELVADTLHMPSDKVDVNQPLSTLGVDSLVGMELQTSISVKFRVQVSILELMKEEDITAMSAQLLKKMNIPSARTAAPDAPEPVAGQTAAWAATGTGSALAGASTSL